MEYYRRDANYKEKSKKNITEDDLEGNHCQTRWSPDLKTLGRFVLLMLQSRPFKLKTISGRNIHTFSLEKKILPSLVLASYMVYFGLALMFYFDF